jgi:hypothetical protein
LVAGIVKKKMKNKTVSRKKEKNKSKTKKEISENQKGIIQLKENNPDLEREIEEEFQEKLSNEFFETQIKPSASAKAPVLEKIMQSEEFSQIPDIIETSQREIKNEMDEGRGNYASSSNTPKYLSGRTENIDENKKYESNFVPPVLKNREIPSHSLRQEFSNQSNERWRNQASEQKMNEIDFIEHERRLPFEEAREKYKRVNLR